MFAIGDKEWPGISKLVEECGEVLQICGKLMGTGGKREHWNCEDLESALEDEIADLMAACYFVQHYCLLDRDRIDERALEKYNTFDGWHSKSRK